MPSSRKSGFKVLITSGPTSVPIDDMRVITNRSTGEMGRLLAAAFVAKGSRVMLLEGAVTTAALLPKSARVKKFYFYDELAGLLRKELSQPYDVIVHAAAVSDFKLKRSFKGKLNSCDQLMLGLVPTRKLIGDIKKKAPSIFLVGFKLGSRLAAVSLKAQAKLLLNKAGCDAVVVNSMNTKEYQAFLLLPDGTATKTVHSKKALVSSLVGLCMKNL